MRAATPVARIADGLSSITAEGFTGRESAPAMKNASNCDNMEGSMIAMVLIVSTFADRSASLDGFYGSWKQDTALVIHSGRFELEQGRPLSAPWDRRAKRAWTGTARKVGNRLLLSWNGYGESPLPEERPRTPSGEQLQRERMARIDREMKTPFGELLIRPSVTDSVLVYQGIPLTRLAASAPNPKDLRLSMKRLMARRKR